MLVAFELGVFVASVVAFSFVFYDVCTYPFLAQVIAHPCHLLRKLFASLSLPASCTARCDSVRPKVQGGMERLHH